MVVARLILEDRVRPYQANGSIVKKLTQNGFNYHNSDIEGDGKIDIRKIRENKFMKEVCTATASWVF